MRLVEKPKKPCFVCNKEYRSFRKETQFVDTGKTFALDYERKVPRQGPIYLCTDCIKAAAAPLGLIPVERLEVEKQRSLDVRTKLRAWESRAKRFASELSAMELITAEAEEVLSESDEVPLPEYEPSAEEE